MLLALSILSSCEKEKTVPQADEVLEGNLLKSGSKYSEVLSKRGSSERAFSIEDIQRVGDVLKIHVKGGCSADEYSVIWDGAVMESYPMQIRLVVANESEETDCGGPNVHVLNISLAGIIGKHSPEDYMVHVANGSAKEDKSLNPDGSVSLQ